VKICLANRFTISSDKYNLILIDKQNGKKERRHYFANVKQLSNFIGELKLREGLDRCEVNLCKNSPLTPSYSSVIEETIVKLERYIDECIHGKK
jgi:hypothetical protein|tara:strand:- start:407 stop:688 length:282 start_codon:yes stop_codon:yes gene_type:complete